MANATLPGAQILQFPVGGRDGSATQRFTSVRSDPIKRLPIEPVRAPPAALILSASCWYQDAETRDSAAPH